MKLRNKILIVIGIILIIFTIFIGRKVWILKDLQRKVSNYTNMTNYYVKIKAHEGQEVIYETYKKDDKYLVKFENLSPNKSKIINYCNGETINTYLETEQNKIAILDTEEAFPSPIVIFNTMDYLSEFFAQEPMKLFLKITSEEYNGKDCYKITCKLVEDEITTWDVYLEKETGLTLKSGTTEYEYQFNCVTEEDLAEPDISQYTIQE